MTFPAHGWLGLALIAVFWPLNWLLSGPRTHWGFFPLWLGYCLVVDGINRYQSGTSLYTRDPRRYVLLFLLSVPLWWLFELINVRTANWRYEGGEFLGDLEYALLASLSFSTVVPAVLGTAELCAGLGLVRRRGRGPVVRGGPRTASWLFVAGVASGSLMLAWPTFFFPFVWLSLYFLLEAVNLWAGNRTVLDWTGRGEWRPVLALWIGVLVCGFFWEMWNYLSWPRWVYHVPGVGFGKVFEMPILGYLGYVPFSLEIFAFVHLALGLSGGRQSDYVTRGLEPAAGDVDAGTPRAL